MKVDGGEEYKHRTPSSNTGVGATHNESSASQSQSRNHLLLSNGSVNTFPWRYDSWTNNPLLGKTYNNT
jgi:hypothetical protein